ncbi:RICIN domain-containing protein [Kitasatospora sp. NPDC088264]
MFKPVPGLPSVYTVNNAADQRSCLTVDSTPSGVQCYANDTSQMWRVTPWTAADSTPRYGLLGIRLQNISTSQCLDNTEHRIGGGWRLYMFDCNQGGYQEWDIARNT